MRNSSVSNAIAALGAVNLAALDELTSSRERRDFLDAQSKDLIEAITTLEDAIRRIDRETRARLKETIERVDADLGQQPGPGAQELEGLGEGLAGIPATAGARSTSASDSGR